MFAGERNPERKQRGREVDTGQIRGKRKENGEGKERTLRGFSETAGEEVR